MKKSHYQLDTERMQRLHEFLNSENATSLDEEIALIRTYVEDAIQARNLVLARDLMGTLATLVHVNATTEAKNE